MRVHWHRMYWAGPMGAAALGPMLHDVWYPPVGSEGDTGQPDLRPAAEETLQPQYDQSDFSNGGRMDSLEVRLDASRHAAAVALCSTARWSVLMRSFVVRTGCSH